MDFNIDEKHRSDLLKISLQGSDKFKARSNSVSMYGGAIKMDTTTSRSILKAITSYENFPITEVETQGGKGGVVTISPPLPGDIRKVKPQNESMKIQSVGFVGCSNDVSIDLDTDELYTYDNIGMLTLDSGVTSEDSQIFISGYEGISEVELGENQRTTVKIENLLAIDNEVQYEEVSSGSFKQRALGASQNPYVRLTGSGRIYTHVRSPIQQFQILEKVTKE